MVGLLDATWPRDMDAPHGQADPAQESRSRTESERSPARFTGLRDASARRNSRTHRASTKGVSGAWHYAGRAAWKEDHRGGAPKASALKRRALVGAHGLLSGNGLSVGYPDAP
jgi:hypothetical protein